MLKKYFGFSSLRAGQEEVIDRVLAGVNTLAVLPTGGGKSLCYQLPALMMDGLAVVVSPLIALMRDQVEGLVACGVAAVRLDSAATEGEREEVMARVVAGQVKLLYLSPERLADPAMIQRLKGLEVSLVAIDEAHCISEWGHSFRPSYIQLPRVVRLLRPRSVLALTATASPVTAAGIRKGFKILKRDQVQTSFFRENLEFDVTVADESGKRLRLLELLSESGRVPAIVYATRRGDVEEVAAYLSRHGVAARSYHAGMSAAARAEVQDGFLDHQVPVICATIAFGMGVDMPDVRTVVHYHPPKSPEGWIQESGRAGRDGKASHCELLIHGDDRAMLEGMVVAKQPGRRAVEAVIQNVFSQGRSAVVSRYNLSTLNDMPVELLDVMLARLADGGWIVPDGGSWMWCHVVPLRWDAAARERILRGFSQNDRAVLEGVMDSRQRVSLWDLADGSVVKLNKLVALFRELEAGGEVKLKMSHSLAHYRVKNEPEKLRVLVDEVMDVIEEHTNHDVARIRMVFEMAVSRKCIAASLVGYFGEKLPEPCGRCASCLGKARPRKWPRSEVEEVTLEEMEKIQVLVAERRPALSSPHRLARFLCGIYSPAMMRYRLYQHRDWGMLSRLGFDEVLAVAQVKY
ncbi:MAG: RecQ family ATP-dependent DNA helicase [Verrucomicrobiae bacterium]|nr:RecQ family ATP-dependent DNA helicase [Verrucomicrobiae bacterium]NNJ42803.1 ATP-dependent DNA helicase RecQ [Akkermansiaceae bacterium]